MTVSPMARFEEIRDSPDMLEFNAMQVTAGPAHRTALVQLQSARRVCAESLCGEPWPQL